MMPTTHPSKAKEKSYSKANKFKSLNLEYEPRTLYQDFYFKPRRKAVDWRLVSSISVDDIVQNTSVSVLQELIENVTFCNILQDSEKSDPNLVKLFQISQLIIEFLVHSQNHLLREKEQGERIVSHLEEQVESQSEEILKLRRNVDEKSKEVKGMKKTLFAYELVSKQTGDGGAAGITYFKCMHCPKAFSNQKYLDSHLSRRHDIKEETKEKTQPDAELQKVVEMMEKFTSSLVNNNNAVTKDATEQVSAQMSKQLEQEKLKFESELQSLKTSLHREVEQERALLKQDREAFERMVNQSRAIAASATKVHVGDLEDDEKSDIVKPRKPSSKPPSTRPLAQKKKDDNLEKKIHEEYEKELKNIQNVIFDQVGRLKQQMIVENEQQNQVLQNKLSMAANEIDRLKSYQGSPANSVDIADLRYPNSYSRDRKEIWKNYSAVLAEFKNIPNPQAPIVTSKYEHPIEEMKNEREMINLDVDRFLSEQGLSEVNVQKMASDPALKSVCTGLSKYISAQRAITTSEVLCYEEMRSLIESQVEKATAAAFRVEDSISPPISSCSGVPPLPRRSSMKKYNSGSLMSPTTKSVKISETAKEHIIEPSVSPRKGLRSLNLQIPPDGFVSNGQHGLVQTSSTLNPEAGHKSPSKAPVDLALKTAETIKNAFSSLTSRTLGITSPKKSEAELKFDHSMGFRKFQMASSVPPPVNHTPTKYIDIGKNGAAPVEHQNGSEKSTSGKDTATTTSENDQTTSGHDQTTSEKDDDGTSDIDITELSSIQHKAAFAPAKTVKSETVKVVKVAGMSKSKPNVEKENSSSDVSFDVSEVSDTDSARNVVVSSKKPSAIPSPEELEDSDFDDDFNVQAKSIATFPPLVQSTVIQVGGKQTLSAPTVIAKPTSSHQIAEKSKESVDDDVLEFLDEIDASLGDHVNSKTKKTTSQIDDIDDFDSI